MKPNRDIDSALHVIKGAVQKVTGAVLTTSVFAEGNRGRLTVEYDGKPTPGEIAEIERLANEKISENVEIEIFEMDRKEAEDKNGRIIYDKFPVPDHIRTLTLTRIADWNINCCLGIQIKLREEFSQQQHDHQLGKSNNERDT
ncbi:MAG: alanyl-tRNA editing protein [Thermoplasmatota archaeon]